MAFNPQRLSIARKRRLLNKKDFALRAGVSDKTIIRCEAGITEPTEENLRTFARVLEFPAGFFMGADLHEPREDQVSFRSQTSMTAAVRDAALAAGAIGTLISDWVEERFTLPAVNVPDLHLYDPEAAARTLRQEWTLGEKPVSNMVHLLESKGVRVFSLAENSKKVNAFSFWRDDKPYVFLNTMKSAENSRFDAAHELGHLVLHQDGRTTGRQAEDQANRFASAFLMPEGDLKAEIGGVFCLDQLVAAKSRWIVSVAALNHRLHRIGKTSEYKYRDFCIDIAKRGYNTQEPKEAARERSVVWQKVLKALWTEKITKSGIASALFLPETEVDALIFGVLYSGDRDRPAASRPLGLVQTPKFA